MKARCVKLLYVFFKCKNICYKQILQLTLNHFRIDTYDEEEEDEGEDHVIDSEKLLVQSIPATTDKESDYIRVEIPLVNVSGNLQLSDPPRHTYNSEELFDFVYDVTPKYIYLFVLKPYTLPLLLFYILF